MANIQMGTADGSMLGNPIAGDFYIFIDSNNANKYTLRNSAGTDTILGGGVSGDLLSTNNLSDVANAVTSLSNLGGEPAFSKNTAFNKDFGTTAGTVLEGDTVLGGSLRNVSATTTFATANETVNCTANTFTVNLPTAVGIQGTEYTLINSGTGVITLDPNGTETINGSLTIDIKRQYTSRTVQSDNANWIII